MEQRGGARRSSFPETLPLRGLRETGRRRRRPGAERAPQARRGHGQGAQSPRRSPRAPPSGGRRRSGRSASAKDTPVAPSARPRRIRRTVKRGEKDPRNWFVSVHRWADPHQGESGLRGAWKAAGGSGASAGSREDAWGRELSRQDPGSVGNRGRAGLGLGGAVPQRGSKGSRAERWGPPGSPKGELRCRRGGEPYQLLGTSMAKHLGSVESSHSGNLRKSVLCCLSSLPCKGSAEREHCAGRGVQVDLPELQGPATFPSRGSSLSVPWSTLRGWVRR